MTKEVAEKIVRGITDKIECNTADIDDWAEFWGFTKEEYEEFLDMAIEALEQEPILDKIRAEIKNDWQLKKFPCSPFSCGLRQAIVIIDKYREEVHHRKVRIRNENRNNPTQD